MNENVSSVYEAIADADGDFVALIQGARRVTWRELDERAARLAAYFKATGLPQGARIVIALWNSPEYVETLLAACKARMVPVNINYRASAKELRHYFERSDAAAIVYHHSLAGTVAEAAEFLKPPRVMLDVADHTGSGSPDYAETIAKTAPAPRAKRSGDDQLIMFTGGTTGLPKAVLWRHRDILSLLVAQRRRRHRFRRFRRGGAGVAQGRHASRISIMLPPLMHSTGLFGTMGALVGGGSVVFSSARSLDPDLVWREIKRERVESLTIVGDVFSRPLTDALRRLPAAESRDAASSLKIVRSVGVRWSPDAKADLLEFGDMVLNDVLASSEGGAVASWETKKIDGKPVTNYTLMPHAFIIDEDSGERIALGSGKTGIVVSAGTLPDGYIGERADGNTRHVSRDGRQARRRHRRLRARRTRRHPDLDRARLAASSIRAARKSSPTKSSRSLPNIPASPTSSSPACPIRAGAIWSARWWRCAPAFRSTRPSLPSWSAPNSPATRSRASSASSQPSSARQPARRTGNGRLRCWLSRNKQPQIKKGRAKRPFL